MLDNQVLVLGDLKIHFHEVSATIVCVNETGHRLLWGVAKGATMSNYQRSVLAVEVRGVRHLGGTNLGDKSANEGLESERCHVIYIN